MLHQQARATTNNTTNIHVAYMYVYVYRRASFRDEIYIYMIFVLISLHRGKVASRRAFHERDMSLISLETSIAEMKRNTRTIRDGYSKFITCL